MTGLIRKATLLLSVCGLLAAGAASANVPDPIQSISPNNIFLVGSAAGVADGGHGQFTVIVKDLGGNVIAGSNVVVDFSGSADVRICSSQLSAGLSVDCPTKSVRKFADGTGTAVFTIEGSGFMSNRTPFSGTVKIFADGVQLSAPIPVGSWDFDGAGVGAGDLSSFLGDFFSGVNPARADFQPDGTVGSTDLSAFLGTFFSGASASNCSTVARCN